MLIPLLLTVCTMQEGVQVPIIELDRDDTVITESCLIVIPDGLVVADTNGDGVIHIQTSGIEVEFTDGSVLRGASSETDLDQLTGIGIAVRGCNSVTLINLHVSGFKVGVLASEVKGFEIRDSQFDGNYAQRLKSNTEKEDPSDWIWPHENDKQEWRNKYGGAISIERSEFVLIEHVIVRRGQNGILLDRVRRSNIRSNDCSFLSGWGIALWRSSDNLVLGNAFDFCVRGYSHGVYNRGQDSAGILMFEQCNRNRIIQNSATHGGDGFFGFAGREALGEVGEHEPNWYNRRGNNDNIISGNDFSYAAAHGLEITFSFGNHILDNTFVGNSICGIWGGFSQDLLIAHNTFRENGASGYGLERGDINIDHGSNNRLLQNSHFDSTCAVHMWEMPTGFSEKPWGKANIAKELKESYIVSSRFSSNGVDFHTRGNARIAVFKNVHIGATQPNDISKESVIRMMQDTRDESGTFDYAADSLPSQLITNPIGARRRLAGRQNIIMTQWGPWDHVSPLE